MHESNTGTRDANLSRRVAMLSPLALTACSFVNKSPFFSTLATFNQRTSPAISRQKIDAVPYATVLAWFDGSARSLMVLGEYLPGNRQVWYSAQSQAMTTWGGVVLTLVGTEVGLQSTTLVGKWSVDPREMVGRQLSRLLTYQAPENRSLVNAESRFVDEGAELVDVFDQRRSLRRVTERVTANRYHHYTNTYWVDEKTGQTWRSRQTVIPTMPPLNLMVTKMPRLGIALTLEFGQSISG